MMKLNDFKEEVYKCSGCGLCQSVCPVYKVLKSECAVSRGKFNLLNAIINKHAQYTKKTLEIMDLCLHCQACTEFCPSGINAQEIIEAAQSDMLEQGIFSFQKLFLLQFLSNKFYMNCAKIFLNILRNSFILKILSLLGFKKIKLLKKYLKINVYPLKTASNKEKKYKALYFKGCVNNYVNPSCENAVKTIFNNSEIEIIETGFECCGLPYKSAGHFDVFKDLAQKNIDMIDENVDYILFDCASCLHTFFEYENFLDENYKEKHEKIKTKFISVYELLDKINFEPSSSWQHNIVTVHYPCHTKNTNEKDFIQKIIKKMPNTEFVEHENCDSCCGAAGTFFVTHSKVSTEISEIKAENIIKSGANIVLTTCPSCVLGLQQGLIEKKSKIKVMQLVELLAQKID